MKLIFKTLIVSFCVFASVASLPAQEKNTFSLKGAIDYAISNNTQVLNATTNERRAIAQKNEVRGLGLPQLNASFDFKDYIERPTSILPDFVGGDLSKTIAVQFGTVYNATAGLSLSQLLFSGDYIVALQSSATFIELSTQNILKTETDVAETVAKSYYAALINKERYKLLSENAERLSRIKDDTEKMYNSGFVEKIDLNKIQVAYNNLVIEKNNLEKLLALGYAMLKYQMGVPMEEEIILTDSLSGSMTMDVSTNTESFTYSNRIEYKMLETQTELSKLNLKRHKYGYLPNLAFYGSLSSQAQRNEFNFFQSNTDKWYPIALIGLTMNVNLFDGLQRNYRIQQTQFDVLENSRNLENLERGIDLELERVSIMLNNSYSSLQNQKDNMEMAREILEVTSKKYKAGTSTSMDVINAESALTEAQSNYFNALYNTLIAKIDFDKATGTLINTQGLD